MKVYVVTDGDYSDYHICGIYSTQELAEASFRLYAIVGGDADQNIEEYELDAHGDVIRSGILSWSVSVFPDGTIDQCFHQDYTDQAHYAMIRPRYDGGLLIQVLAPDGLLARKIAIDRRNEYLAKKEGVAV